MISADPLQSLKNFEEKLKKDISNIQAQFSGNRSRNQELKNTLLEKQKLLRTTVEVCKTQMYSQKEVELADEVLQQMAKENTQLESSSKLIGKKSFASMNLLQKSCLNNIKVEGKEINEKYFANLMRHAKQIEQVEKQQKALIDKELQDLQLQLNNCHGDLQVAQQKLNVISSIPDTNKRMIEIKKVSQLIENQKLHKASLQTEIKKLESTKDALDSRLEGVFLDSFNYYLKNVSEKRLLQAKKDVEQAEKSMNRCDICFLIDGSKSMTRLIEKAKSRVYDIIDGVKQKFPDVTFRLGCVIYRDIDLGSNHTSAINFSEHKDTFIEWLSEVECIRNSDECEDVGGGLMEVLKLNWQSPTRCLVHFGDQPCHGRRFYSEEQPARFTNKSGLPSQDPNVGLMLPQKNNSVQLKDPANPLLLSSRLNASRFGMGLTFSNPTAEPKNLGRPLTGSKLREPSGNNVPIHGYDNYPNYPQGVPGARSYEDLLRELKSLGIDYNFMKMTLETETMVEEFQKIWDSVGIYAKNSGRVAEFRTYSLSAKADDFVNQICMAVIDSLTLTKSSDGLTLLKIKDKNQRNHLRVDQVIIENEVQELADIEWTTANRWPTEKGKLYSVNLKTSIDDVLEKGIKLFEGEFAVCISSEPFAKGTFNLAYAALLLVNNQKLVAKIAKDSQSDQKNKEHLLKQELKKKGIAIVLAREFNRLVKQTNFPWALLQFIHTFYYKTPSKDILLEGFIEGSYEKFSNNYDSLDTSKETRHLTAFSHFSYERTNGNYLVTDFQGVNGFLLTDPALHSKTHEFIESGDYSEKGFVMFFSKHKCNSICKALNLRQPNIPVAQISPWIERAFEHQNYFKFKCDNVFCNKGLVKGEKFWCKTCKALQKQQKTVMCKRGGQHKHTFTYNPWRYLLKGMHEPKTCDDCRRKRGKRTLKDLGDDFSD